VLFASVIFSLVIPFNKAKIQLDGSIGVREYPAVTKQFTDTFKVSGETNKSNAGLYEEVKKETTGTKFLVTINWINLLCGLYFAIAVLLLSRVFYQVIRLVLVYIRSDKTYCNGYSIIYNSKYNDPFSFFSWIFISSSQKYVDTEKIISHEKVHVSQLHSIDLLLIELLSFN
jgi:hypothetical protein